MSEPIEIPIADATTGYDGLQRAFRARADELQLSRTQIEELAGLTGGHAGKLLAPYPVRAIGRTTLGPLLYALKAKLILVPDESIVWTDDPGKRNESQARSRKPLETGIANIPEVRSIRRKVLHETLSKFGRKGGLKSAKARASKSPEERSRIARKAARTRRRRERERRRATRCAPTQPASLSSKPRTR